jgi:GGDEF domain-containing protein
MDRLARAIDAHAFPKRRRLNVHIGWAVFPDDAAEREGLLTRATNALDEAKARARSGAPGPTLPPLP